jgi:hypothetical protein
MDPSIPVAMLVATLALMLGFTSRRTAGMGLTIATGAALVSAQTTLPAAWSIALITVCSLGTVILVLLIFWPARLSRLIALVLSVVVGVITGLGHSLAAMPQNIYPALAAGALALPALVAIERGYAIAVRVVASWLVAIAVLAALLPYVVSHPGYVSEHRQ